MIKDSIIKNVACHNRQIAGRIFDSRFFNKSFYSVDAVATLIGISPIHAVTLIGFHADTGNPGGMLEAAIYLAKQDPALSDVVNKALGK
jgi:UTP-glucose-1-phosphate uridylyltransferase